MTRFTFIKAQHLRSKSDFERVYALKNKAADGVLLVFAARNEGPVTRIGLSVSKKHGGAIVRNRLKRLLREAFRLMQHQIPARQGQSQSGCVPGIPCEGHSSPDAST